MKESSDEDSTTYSSDESMSSIGSANSATSLQEMSPDRPGFMKQFQILTLRRLVQWWRMNRQRGIFVVALALGGVVLAILDGYITKTPSWDAMAYLNLHTCLALLLSIFCLSVFGNDQPVFWRESASGINVQSYYVAKILINTVDVVLMTFVFTTVYFLIRQPYISYWRFIIPFIFTAYASAGWGYFISTIVPPQHGPFIVSLVSFIICGLLGNPSTLANFMDIPVMDIAVSAISISRWAVQMSFLIAYDHMNPDPTDARQKAMLGTYEGVYVVQGETYGHSIGMACIWLFIMGFVLRILSFLGLKFTNRSKQV
eukprot:CAMPEP_0206451558 /NCGR_PEP_ID=MMETSP0324_2-20121206/19416_1 /ASSEMBLY_ACC=CAM_ASM_000836 /TAXON_ID=2866 /ORGANISM="Crypthecodinium cohnii, Strain Seligo" /LENGTH=313 /DNA_ID=CAMNT_0053921469 /DNA_START=1028 /DNA_END=1969 /DNA_ORIENTATION=-